MAVLIRAAVAAAAIIVCGLAGCYSPSLRDCTVSCGSEHDCAAGQRCGSDGLCASPEIAGQCAARAPDAGRPDDAGALDAPADAAIDGPARIALHVMIAGKGSVEVDGRGTCSSADPQRGDCTFQVAPHVEQTVHAVTTQLDQVFTGWTSQTCRSQGDTCTFTPTGATTISAKFEKVGSP